MSSEKIYVSGSSKDNPQGGWKRIGTDGQVLGPCARDDKDGDGDGDGPKPKCMSNKKDSSTYQKTNVQMMIQ